MPTLYCQICDRDVPAKETFVNGIFHLVCFFCGTILDEDEDYTEWIDPYDLTADSRH